VTAPTTTNGLPIFPDQDSGLETPWFYGILNPVGRYKLAPASVVFSSRTNLGWRRAAAMRPFCYSVAEPLAHAPQFAGVPAVADYQP